MAPDPVPPVDSATSALSGGIAVGGRFRGRPVAHLGPGELLVSNEPRAVATILGSCVAVCLWDPDRAVGGVTHYLLPEIREGQDVSPRYGDVGIAVLLEKLVGMGAHPTRIVGKIFGGGCVVGDPAQDLLRVGEKNVAVAVDMLQRLAIPVAGRDVGGSQGRKLIFLTDDGSAWVRPI